MRILFLAKKNSWCDNAANYLKNNFTDVLIFQGNVGDDFPNECFAWKGEYIISFLSPWVIPKNVLANARKIAINFHPGTPKYGGIGCYNFALYNEEKEYGVLCHEMLEKVDSGRIIKINTFPIKNNETVLGLKEKSLDHLLELFYEIMQLIKTGKELPKAGQTWEQKPYTRKDLQSLCRITQDMPQKEIQKRIQATYYPDGPDWPYIDIDGKIIVLKEILFQ
jgi:methionyl-tRNA formyltransferase